MALYKDMMWFGNRNYMQWVRAPQINYDSSKRGYASTATFLNGGAFVKRSATAAKGYNFTWTLKNRDEVRAINDYADGVFGPGAVYFLDPFAMDKNLLPQFWAVPSLASLDAPLLAGMYDEDRPSILPTTPNANGYPFNTAIYTLTAGLHFSQVWLPCPPGYSLWFGAHGSATGTAGVIVTPTTGPNTVGDIVSVPLLAESDITRVNTQINGDAYSGALLSFSGVGTLNLSGLMAQCFPNGTTPPLGGFVSGQGHSGCSFVEEPTLTNYSVGIDRAGIVANLVETEGWL
jgi:hypothetical protein